MKLDLKRIRYMRETLEITPEEMASRMGLSSPIEYIHYEMGDKDLGVSDLEKIAEILGQEDNVSIFFTEDVPYNEQ